MKKLWITYSWKDNEEKDVDFIAQQLDKHVQVKLDKWVLSAGQHLWEQLDNHISNQNESDAWLIYATQNSLGSGPCKEEYAYALQRALETRGTNFPVIALFPSSVESNLIPSGIRTRLFVSLLDPDWEERIISAVENRQPSITTPIVEPYVITLHKSINGDNVIEIRPRAGTWSPFIILIPEKIAEKDVKLQQGPRNSIANYGPLYNRKSGSFARLEGRSGGWRYIQANNEATPTQSYYLVCKKVPSEIIFGAGTAETDNDLYSVLISDLAN